MSLSQHWQQHIDAWLQTGGSQAQYCRSHDIDQSQFSYWKCKLVKHEAPHSSRSSKFAIAHLETRAESSLSITLPNGTMLSGIDALNAPVAVQLLEYL